MAEPAPADPAWLITWLRAELAEARAHAATQNPAELMAETLDALERGARLRGQTTDDDDDPE